MTSRRVQRTYLTLILLQTLSISLIWGINTLFLLDGGLSLTEAFIVNAGFSAGMVIFEVPTGVVADAAGRRISFILGGVTLLLTTLAYYWLWSIQAGLLPWTVVSILIGLGFTFFSGATEAWLVDALKATGFKGAIDDVFGRSQTVMGAATLLGLLTGGFLAQISLGVPYLVRSGILLAVIGAGYLTMHDIGFEPKKAPSLISGIRSIVRDSLTHGFGNPAVRKFMLGAPFSVGVFFWIYYAFQPYVLELFEREDLVFLAGLAAAVFALAQIVGGALVRRVRTLFRRRTSFIAGAVVAGSLGLAGVGLAELLPVPIGFWVAVALFGVVSLSEGMSTPVRQAYMSEVIPSEQRATVLSFDSLLGNSGGLVGQPLLGRVADVYSLGIGYLVSAALYLMRLPFVLGVRRLDLEADRSGLPPVQPRGIM